VLGALPAFEWLVLFTQTAQIGSADGLAPNGPSEQQLRSKQLVGMS
jgi:hypothetical protein